MSEQHHINYAFDASQVAPDAGRQPIPAGEYNVKIHDTKTYEMQGNKGWGFIVTFEVVDGQYAGHRFENRYNIGHSESQKTVEIHKGQLSALCHVVGFFNLNMGNQGADLRGRLLKATINNGGEYNNLTSVADTQGNKPGRSAGHASAHTAPVAGGAPSGWGTQAAAPAQQNAAPAQQAWGQQAAPQQGNFAPAQNGATGQAPVQQQGGFAAPQGNPATGFPSNQPAQQGFAAPQQQAPAQQFQQPAQGYAPNPGQPPQGYAQQGNPGFAQAAAPAQQPAQAPAAWGAPQGAPNGAPPAWGQPQ